MNQGLVTLSLPLRRALYPVLPTPRNRSRHLLRQIRLGAITDHHVARREQHPRILALALASTGLGLLLLRLLGAPPELVALLAAGGVALGVALLITLRWKISVHVGAIAGLAVVYAFLLGPRALPFTVLVPLVIWARVETGAHSSARSCADRYSHC